MPQMHGAVIIDLMGLILTAEEKALIAHPHVGGVILFSRNFESITQISELCCMIRECRKSPLLICVDQEGGRVQRFKTGFIQLPSMKVVGQYYQHSASDGLQLAYTSGWIMAAELLAIGVDLSFAPVLDLDRQYNTVIGDRSFGGDSNLISILAKQVMSGMHDAGMAATGKHFPGHGGVDADSHTALPIDTRDYPAIYAEDMQPFINLIKANIGALMPAHILFSAVDKQPVGFSKFWLQEILRKKLQFSGVIFSDDLNMAAAQSAGNYVTRAQKALDAGCDMVLICNNRLGAIEILDHLPEKYFLSSEKFNFLKSNKSPNLSMLHASTAWQKHLNLFNLAQENLCKLLKK